MLLVSFNYPIVHQYSLGKSFPNISIHSNDENKEYFLCAKEFKVYLTFYLIRYRLSLSLCEVCHSLFDNVLQFIMF